MHESEEGKSGIESSKHDLVGARKKFTAYLVPEAFEALKRFAQSERRSINNMVNVLIMRAETRELNQKESKGGWRNESQRSRAEKRYENPPDLPRLRRKRTKKGGRNESERI